MIRKELTTTPCVKFTEKAAQWGFQTRPNNLSTIFSGGTSVAMLKNDIFQYTVINQSSNNRLDVKLAQLSDLGRPAAKELIVSGGVRVNGVIITKPGTMIQETDDIDYDLPMISYVSRGGRKLQAALEAFEIDLKGQICLDIGASTGGFTDCMLHHGATLVYALDVGTAQLHPKLRADSRVRSIEKTNVLAIKPDDLDPTPQFAVIDVSFVSASKVLPYASLLLDGTQIVVLIKPQFECGRSSLNKHGVVKDKKTHKKAVELVSEAVKNSGLTLRAVIESPIKGGDGNTEYLALFEKERK